MKPADECRRREDKVRDPQRVSGRYDLVSFIYITIFSYVCVVMAVMRKVALVLQNVTTRLIWEIKQNRHLQRRA
jgi:hypothetical protein